MSERDGDNGADPALRAGRGPSIRQRPAPGMGPTQDDNGGQGEQEQGEPLRPAMDPAEFRRRRAEAAARREGKLLPAGAETAAIKHGLYSQRLSYLPCDVCALAKQCEHYQPGEQCPLERAWMEHRRPRLAQAMQEAGRDPDLHAAQITAAVHAEIRYLRNWGYLLVDGEVRPDPERDGMLRETPSSKRVERLRHQMDKAFEELGLSPTALARLQADRKGAAGAEMVQAILQMGGPARVAIGPGEAVEAEFEAAPAEPPGKGQGARGKGETATAGQEVESDA